jgi:hypothetical protein
MVVSGKRDHLSLLCTSGQGVSWNEAAKQLQEIMLVRENVDLCWIWKVWIALARSSKTWATSYALQLRFKRLTWRRA